MRENKVNHFIEKKDDRLDWNTARLSSFFWYKIKDIIQLNLYKRVIVHYDRGRNH